MHLLHRASLSETPQGVTAVGLCSRRPCSLLSGAVGRAVPVSSVSANESCGREELPALVGAHRSQVAGSSLCNGPVGGQPHSSPTRLPCQQLTNGKKPPGAVRHARVSNGGLEVLVFFHGPPICGTKMICLSQEIVLTFKIWSHGLCWAPGLGGRISSAVSHALTVPARAVSHSHLCS